MWTFIGVCICIYIGYWILLGLIALVLKIIELVKANTRVKELLWAIMCFALGGLLICASYWLIKIIPHTLGMILGGVIGFYFFIFEPIRKKVKASRLDKKLQEKD
jgi:hypothetical protein